MAEIVEPVSDISALPNGTGELSSPPTRKPENEGSDLYLLVSEFRKITRTVVKHIGQRF